MEKDNARLKILLGTYLILMTAVLVVLRKFNIISINWTLLVLFLIAFTYSILILIVVQHRNASDVPLFNNSLAFIVILIGGIAGQLYDQEVWKNIWTWVVIGAAAVGSVQNIIAPILEKLMKDKRE